MAERSMLGRLLHASRSRSRSLLGDGAHSSSASALLIRNTAFGLVARYYSTFSFSCPAAKTRSPTTGMSSIIAHPMKPAFVDFIRGPKRTFSSEIIKHGIDWEAERAKMEAKLEAIKKVSTSADVEAENEDVRADFERCKAFLDNLTDTSNAELAVWREEMDKDAAKFDRFLNGILCVLAGLAAYGFYLVHCGIESRHQRLVAARANVEDQNPCVCKCHCDSSVH